MNVHVCRFPPVKAAGNAVEYCPLCGGQLAEGETLPESQNLPKRALGKSAVIARPSLALVATGMYKLFRLAIGIPFALLLGIMMRKRAWADFKKYVEAGALKFDEFIWGVSGYVLLVGVFMLWGAISNSISARQHAKEQVLKNEQTLKNWDALKSHGEDLLQKKKFEAAQTIFNDMLSVNPAAIDIRSFASSAAIGLKKEQEAHEREVAKAAKPRALRVANKVLKDAPRIIRDAIASDPSYGACEPRMIRVTAYKITWSEGPRNPEAGPFAIGNMNGRYLCASSGSTLAPGEYERHSVEDRIHIRYKEQEERAFSIMFGIKNDETYELLITPQIGSEAVGTIRHTDTGLEKMNGEKIPLESIMQ